MSKSELITYIDPKSPISEVFRTLRTNIQFMATHKKLKTILITSTLPGEGKSYIASNLAITFAQAGKKVVLIDGDMRKGRLFKIFGIKSKPGLSNYLCETDLEESNIDIEDYMNPTEIEKLWILPAGNVPPNPSELLVSEQMMKLLEDLKRHSDIIIIDGTPSDLVTDSIILSRIVDATVVVTAFKKTKKETLKKVIKSIKNVGGNLAGIVLNKVPMSEKRYSEKYYYSEGVDIGVTKIGKRMNDETSLFGTEKKSTTEKVGRREKTIEKPKKENIQIIKEKEVYSNRKNYKKPHEKSVLEKKVDTKNPNSYLSRTHEMIEKMNNYIDEQKKIEE